MTLSDDFWRALQDYTLAFPDLASLGAGNPPASWLAERNAVKTTARSAVLITSANAEGGSGAGQRNFSPSILIDALDWRRNQLDSTYALPPHLKRNEASALILRFGPPPTIGV